MRQIKNKLVIIIFFVVFIIGIAKIVDAKYVIDKQFCAVNLAIDRQRPLIEVLEIQNSNLDYEGYANKCHTISIKIKIMEKYIKNVYLDKEHIKVKIAGQALENCVVNIKEVQTIKEGKVYLIELKELLGDGDLEVQILEGSIVDTSNLENEIKEIKTNIIIDNTVPEIKLVEDKIDGGKVNAIIQGNEKIRELEGWNLLENKQQMEKIFTNNISYELPIQDYAGNQVNFGINITQATFINIEYASHNSNVGWTYGYGNYDIAGSNAVKADLKFKTEAIAFRITGNVTNDFVQANSYVYTHWGEGSIARCSSSNLVFNYGYNPGIELYKSMNSNDLVTIQGKKYFQIGGAGVNAINYTDINGNKPITADSVYKYGICGIKMRLKDYSQFSIVYQVLVSGIGWTEASSNGQECMYSKLNPISAFRIALVPNSEIQYVINTWNKDVGTYNL